MALMGVLPAVAVAVGVGILNYYTLWLLIVLYLERKRIMVAPRHLKSFFFFFPSLNTTLTTCLQCDRSRLFVSLSVASMNNQ